MSERALSTKTSFLTGISTRVACGNTSLNHSGGPYFVSPSVSQCKFYGGPLYLRHQTANQKKPLQCKFLHILMAYFNALTNFINLKNVYFIILPLN